MHKKYFWSILLVVYVGFVYGNSLTPAVESSAQSMKVLELVTSAISAVGLGNVGVTEHVIRKAAHVSEYAVLGILLVQCLNQYGLWKVLRWQIHILMGFLIPFADETLQLFTEGRSGQISDVWLDCSGVLAGTLLILGWRMWRRRRRRRRTERLEKQEEKAGLAGKKFRNGGHRKKAEGDVY